MAFFALSWMVAGHPESAEAYYRRMDFAQSLWVEEAFELWFRCVMPSPPCFPRAGEVSIVVRPRVPSYSLADIESLSELLDGWLDARKREERGGEALAEVQECSEQFLRGVEKLELFYVEYGYGHENQGHTVYESRVQACSGVYFSPNNLEAIKGSLAAWEAQLRSEVRKKDWESSSDDEEMDR